jgi:nucleoside-diphosphate-sugar epimerase
MNGTKKILITGSSGFIGSAIVEQLKQSDYQVFLSTRKKSEVVDGSVIFIDLLKPETIIGLSDKHNFDIIVHFGAQIGWTDKDEKVMLMSNIISTSLLASEAMKMESKLIFASTVIVHGVCTENIDIDSAINPDTYYAKSKWLAEELIRMSGVNHCILRIGGVFGLNGPTHLGLNRTISEVIKKISPKIYGDGSAKRNYIYLWDIAKAVDVIIENNITGVHFLAGSERSTVSSMVTQVCTVLGEGISPDKQSGNKAKSQLVNPSDVLPKTRSFQNGLEDIKLRLYL